MVRIELGLLDEHSTNSTALPADPLQKLMNAMVSYSLAFLKLYIKVCVDKLI